MLLFLSVSPSFAEIEFSGGVVISGKQKFTRPVNWIPSVAQAPTILGSTLTELTITWPDTVGAVSYKLTRATNAGMSTGVTDLGTRASGYTNTGLAQGTTYYYTVTAVNATGPSTPSAPGSGATGQLPAEPGAPVINVVALASLQVTWNAAARATSYTVIRATDSGMTQNVTVFTNKTSPYADTGLANGTPFWYTVTAVNGYGSSTPSLTGTASTMGVPDAPTGVTAVAGNASATVTFAAPSSNGGGAMVYAVTGGGTDTNAGTSNLTHAITGLTNGTPYTFTVKATNSAGQGVGGTSNTVTPAGVPGAPTSVTATAGNTTASVTFVAPSSNGGGAMVYAVTGGGTDTNAGASNLTHAITGLTNGTPYIFTVKATNSAGQGAGGTSNTVTPIATSSITFTNNAGSAAAVTFTGVWSGTLTPGSSQVINASSFSVTIIGGGGNCGASTSASPPCPAATGGGSGGGASYVVMGAAYAAAGGGSGGSGYCGGAGSLGGTYGVAGAGGFGSSGVSVTGTGTVGNACTCYSPDDQDYCGGGGQDGGYIAADFISLTSPVSIKVGVGGVVAIITAP
ncbi:MAG: hypothetical protein HQL17_05175 [Candidatus Omnitrophica bacterium]|nr:hypothetical protein [Candidatus Omnitrophota bacterium]